MMRSATPQIGEPGRTLVAEAKRSLLIRLGNRLSLSRRRARFTQAKAAQELGISTQTVRNWESGRNEPPHSALTKLEALYKVSEGHFLRNLDTAISPVLTGPKFRYNRVFVELDKMSQARKEAGLTQAKVAEMTGLSLSAIRRYESGSANPTTRALLTLATIYNRPAGWFTARGYFTERENEIFAASIAPRQDALRQEPLPPRDPVTATYDQIKQDLSEEAKSRIVNFMLFTHDLDLSGHGDDFQKVGLHASRPARLPDNTPSEGA